MSLLLTPYVEFFIESFTSRRNTERFCVNLESEKNNGRLTDISDQTHTPHPPTPHPITPDTGQNSLQAHDICQFLSQSQKYYFGEFGIRSVFTADLSLPLRSWQVGEAVGQSVSHKEVLVL